MQHPIESLQHRNGTDATSRKQCCNIVQFLKHRNKGTATSQHRRCNITKITASTCLESSPRASSSSNLMALGACCDSESRDTGCRARLEGGGSAPTVGSRPVGAHAGSLAKARRWPWERGASQGRGGRREHVGPQSRRQAGVQGRGGAGGGTGGEAPARYSRWDRTTEL